MKAYQDDTALNGHRASAFCSAKRAAILRRRLQRFHVDFDPSMLRRSHSLINEQIK